MIARSTVLLHILMLTLGFEALEAGAAAQAPKPSLTGGIETTSVLYSDGKFRSNNYLKLDFVSGAFSAGIQAEYYPDPLLGYDVNLKGIGLPGKYIAWNSGGWSITAGDFHDQFGTGILLRSWEDRMLGWDNAVGGGRLSYHTPDGRFSVKVLGGVPRKYLCYSATNRIAGTEASLRLGGLTLEGSATVRHDGMQTTPGGALGASWYGKGFSARGEYVISRSGNAQTLELGYARKAFSSALLIRRLDRMEDPMGMNYLPSLSLEQTYMLAGLNPYTTFAQGELGGNLNLFYRFKKWKFHVNGALILALPSALEGHSSCRLAYRDINVEIERRWNRALKTILYLSIQENSPTHGQRNATNAQNVLVLDGVYKTRGPLSLRLQAQYLYSQELTRDWVAGLLELSSTKGWNIHLRDMYNHGDTREHYYEAGAGWTRGAFKADLSYGHQRAGLVCSGGVCRWQPEYTGGMLRMTYNF